MYISDDVKVLIIIKFVIFIGWLGWQATIYHWVYGSENSLCIKMPYKPWWLWDNTWTAWDFATKTSNQRQIELPFGKEWGVWYPLIIWSWRWVALSSRTNLPYCHPRCSPCHRAIGGHDRTAGPSVSSPAVPALAVRILIKTSLQYFSLSTSFWLNFEASGSWGRAGGAGLSNWSDWAITSDNDQRVIL